MYFYLMIALKLYCFYHFYKNRTDYYWIFVIIFIPVLGPILYLVTQVYNKRDAEKITTELTHIINPTKKVKDLEKQLEFSESYQNRVNLADAYFEIKDYNNALPHYLEALDDSSQTDFYVSGKLVEVYFLVEDYNNAILYGDSIKTHTEFKKSRIQFIYGLAHEKLENFEEAEAHLRQIDIRYSFYEERLILAKFLISRDKTDDAKDILEDVSSESKHMTKPNKRLYRNTVLEVEKLLNDVNSM